MARGVAHPLVSQLLLAVLPDQSAIRPDQDGGIVGRLPDAFHHPRHQMDIEFVSQRLQSRQVGTARDFLPQSSPPLDGHRLVADGISIEETFGGNDELGPPGRRLTNERLGPLIIALLVGGDPLEHDAGDAHGVLRSAPTHIGRLS